MYTIKCTDKIKSFDHVRVAKYDKLQNGKRHGKYYELQNIKGKPVVVTEGQYCNDKCNGIWFFNVIDNIWIMKCFIDNKLEGDTYLLPRRKSTIKHYRRSYINNELFGSEIDYKFPKFNIKSVSSKRRGVLHGATYVYDTDGDYSSYVVSYYDNGVITERRRYYKNKMISYELYNSGRLIWGLDHTLPNGTRVTYKRIGSFSKLYIIIVNHVISDVIVRQLRFVNGYASYNDIVEEYNNGIVKTVRIPYKRCAINGVIITRVGKYVVSRATYKDNKPHGPSTTYMKGIPVSRVYFDRGIPIREEILRANGETSSATDIVFTQAGKIKTKIDYYEGGNKKKVEITIEDNVVLVQTWDVNGNLIGSTGTSVNNILPKEA
jgi:hypothetical protein